VSRRALVGAGAAAGTIAGAAASLLLPGTAHAQLVDATKSKLQEVLSRGHLIVGTGSTNPPWHFEDESGTLVGMDIDMGHLLAKGLFSDPAKVEYVQQGADARIPSLLTGKVDIVIQFMTVTPGRAQQVAFTYPYYREGVGLQLMADSEYKDYAALKAAGSKIRVGVLQNVYAEQWVHAALPEAEVDQFNSTADSVQALNARRVDAREADLSAIRWMMLQFPERYREAGYAWMPNSYAMAVRQGDPVWLNWVNTAIKEAMMGVDFDSMAASYKKWFGIELQIPKTGFPTEFS
jgi:polar amino acid transport system substrate-binding protein